MTAPASRKTHRAPQPQDVPEVAHNGHGDVDSRGLLLAPDNDLAWTRGPLGRHSLVPVHGGYSDPEAPTTLRPCYLCGEPTRPVHFAYATDLEYAVCGYPLDWGDGSGVAMACLDRAARERAAVTALIAAPAEPEAAVEPVAGEPAEAAAKAPPAPRKPRARASTARTKQAAKAAEAAAEDATEPPEGAA